MRQNEYVVVKRISRGLHTRSYRVYAMRRGPPGRDEAIRCRIRKTRIPRGIDFVPIEEIRNIHLKTGNRPGSPAQFFGL